VEIGGGEGRVLESRFGVRGASRGAGITRTGTVDPGGNSILKTTHRTPENQLKLKAELGLKASAFSSRKQTHLA
jgi:hypothetical protein